MVLVSLSAQIALWPVRTMYSVQAMSPTYRTDTDITVRSRMCNLATLERTFTHEIAKIIGGNLSLTNLCSCH